MVVDTVHGNDEEEAKVGDRGDEPADPAQRFVKAEAAVL